MSAGLDQKIEMIQYLSAIKTDHRAVYLVAEVSKLERGRGFWKLNTTLLQKTEYLRQMNEEIEKTISICKQKSAREKWEILKTRIKKKSLDSSKTQVTQDKLVISELTEIVNYYESSLPLDFEQSELLDKTKKDLEEKCMETIKGVMFRSKAKWYEEGERNTKYFFALEKARYNSCYKLLSEDGVEIEDQVDIVRRQKEFHEELYDVDQDVNFTIQNTFGIKVSEEVKHQQDKLVISELTEIVNYYESSLPLDFEQSELLDKTKKDLEEKCMETTKGVMFRSKAKWYEEGERNTKYFFALEKARYNSCYKLLSEDRVEIEDQVDILRRQKEFYEELYDVDQDVNFTIQNTFGIKVSEEVKHQQELQITIGELELAIKAMNNNKTPGEDGLPVDFYKVFWNKIKEVFYEMVCEVYQEGLLQPSARKGILNLIPKANKDTRIIKNLRPITLLNTDYKIIEKAIANKMSLALDQIIHKDQRGFMKDRRISVNIRKMLDIINEAKKEDLEAVDLSLDFVKCFEKCSFSILHGSLEFFGFGEVVKKWTQILYRDFTVKIQNNGHFSEEIKIRKGVHQGGCCSSVYFLVIAEILDLALRHNNQIEGIMIKDIKVY